METITEQKFIELVKTAPIDSDYEIAEVVTGYTDDEPDTAWGWIGNCMTIDNYELTYHQTYTHTIGKPSTAALGEYEWGLGDLTVINEDGEELEEHEICELLSEHTYIDDVDTDILGDDETENIDIDGDTEMETITVKRDNDRDIKFLGEEIASASSSAESSRSDYSGSVGRWTELTLYRTKNGKYICEQIGYTAWQGEHDRFSAAICETEDGVVEFFGTGWLSKELYESAGIDAAVEVE